MRAGLLALALLAGCQAGGTGEHTIEINPADHLPEGYPPKIGSVTGELNGQPTVWDTYDYSIGAFDAAAQLTGWDGVVRFRLAGDPQGKPSSDAGVLILEGVSAGKMATGALTDVLIEIKGGKEWNGPRLSSAGQAAEVVVDSLIDKGDGAYGHFTGHFSATLCAATGDPVVVDTTRCQPVRGTFDTDFQFNNL